VHLAKQIAAEGGVEVDAERRREAVIDRLLIGEALVVETEQRIRTGIDGDVHARIREQLPRLLWDTCAVIEDVVRAQHAGLGEFRAELGEIADELGQDLHVEPACDFPPVEIELTEEANPHPARPIVPVQCEAFEVLRQMGIGRFLVHCRTDHVQRPDAGRVQCFERRIGVLRAA